MKDHPPATSPVLPPLGPESLRLVSVVVSLGSCTAGQFWSVGQTGWQGEEEVGVLTSCLPHQCLVLSTVLESVLLLERSKWLVQFGGPTGI